MRICTVMVSCDVQIARYAVMRGEMCGERFDERHAEVVATYDVERTYDFEPFAARVETPHCELSARHATEDAPPVPWQAPSTGDVMAGLAPSSSPPLLS